MIESNDFLELIELNNFHHEKIETLMKNCSICINLIGILFEKRGGNTFYNIHSAFPYLLAKMCKKFKLSHFIHVSALGINSAIDSKYAQSKLAGEINIQ